MRNSRLALPLVTAGRLDLAALGIFAVVSRVSMEMSSARLLRGHGLVWHLVPALVAKDRFIFACWFVAPFKRTASRHGRAFRLLHGGRIAALDTTGADLSALLVSRFVGSGRPAVACPATPEPRIKSTQGGYQFCKAGGATSMVPLMVEKYLLLGGGRDDVDPSRLHDL